MAAPTRYPDWATSVETSPAGAPNKVDVPSEFATSGLKAGEPLPRPYLNDQFNLIGQWVRHLEEEISNIVVTPSAAIIQQIYIVGSIWQVTGSENPGTQLGFGTWERIEGRFLVGRDSSDSDFNVSTEVGGNKSHTHTDTFAVQSAGAHSHTISRDNWGALQTGDHLPEPSTPGRLVTGSGRGEISEELESLGHASADKLTSTAGGHTHNLSGGIGSASNLPPYYVINIWRRTA